MSEGIVIAIITAGSSLVCEIVSHVIVGQATIKAATIKVKANPFPIQLPIEKVKRGGGVMGFISGAIIGAVIGAIAAAFIFRIGFFQVPTSGSSSTPDTNCMTTAFSIREPANQSETKTYIRCPVGQVQYSLQVDDTLNSIVLSCPNQPDENIHFSKNEALSANQQLITWDSESFRSEEGCKVKITITNNYDQIGYTIRQEIIAP